jgi:CcmD family protein
MNPMNYLFAAYVAIWLILAVYLFSIHSRERKLRADIERLKQVFDKSGTGRTERGRA